jgi:arabinogalactan oligomer/maltooligosaccharide transport system permease protein
MTDLKTTDQRDVQPSRGGSGLGLGFWVKLFGLAILDALAVYAFLVFFANGDWPIGFGLIALVLFINWVYLWPGTKALRWVTPGLTFMLIFLVIPIIFTAFISLTNWSTGNALTKDQAIEILEQLPYIDPEADEVVFDLFVYQDAGGETLLYMVGTDGEIIAGFPRDRTDEAEEDGTVDLTEFEVTDADGDGIPEQIDDYSLLSGPALFRVANELTNLVVDLPDGVATPVGTRQARVVQGSQRYVYDESTDTLFDNASGEPCVPDEGNFVCADGARIDPGWRILIGLENYTDALTNGAIRRPVVNVFIWNFVFAFGSVLFTFVIGLLLALTFNHERMRGTILYRSIYILPYAIPAGLSVLIWRGLLNTQFGQVNQFLGNFGIDPIPWLTDATWAKVALLLVNTWLGFTYMYLISTGALQSVPSDLQEAARTDGANGWQVFRKITFPLLMVSLAPLLIGSFAFNFNNFVIVEFLTQGGPPVLDAAVPVGATDILITFTYELAVSSGRGNQFGLGAAFTMMIFFVLIIISSISFRFTKRLEDIYGGL